MFIERWKIIELIGPLYGNGLSFQYLVKAQEKQQPVVWKQPERYISEQEEVYNENLIEKYPKTLEELIQ